MTIVPRLIIHGGAGKRPSIKRQREIEKALGIILKEAYPVLLEKGAVEAAVQAVVMLEDNPLFNAGTGSRLQSDGRARLTASLMDGHRQRFSAVVNIEKVKNPIKVAHLLQMERFTVLAGREATAFARVRGFRPYNPITKESLAEWEKHCEGTGPEPIRFRAGTVGAVAIDSKGNIASATSTGGVGCETPGRISDVASPCGTYANGLVGVSCSGRGEDIVNAALAVRVATRVTDGMGLKGAMKLALRELEAIGGKAGMIALDKEGQALCLCNTKFMSYAVK
ncbi:MAG TPA: isoaspartyl peptidase/L-asparaginase [Candidatus Tripitaka californicus]|uniref:isoaspartyl peptidase/L-asparaginase n=1 Tax=Candidatus Tripitaka californicus TaxID=3367616 RepID=UPI004025A80F|nr:isoaspartyl peptidase/L-asparaginase [Planctomycetota bacterium]